MRSKVILAEQEVDPHCAGMELGVYARQHLGISNRRLQKAVRTRGLRLNGRPAHSKRKLRPGDRVQVALPAKEQVKIPVADPKNLKVLYEDPWLLAVDKPAGLPSYSLQDARGAANQVAGHFLAQGLQLTPRPLHRLDTPASGVLVFAKDAETQTALTALWNEGQVQRRYYAICQGRLETAQEIKERLDGQEALTKVKPLSIHPHCTELRAELITGRTHQIRRHLAALGHPLLGDRRYGTAVEAGPRLALHACEVSFPHPHKKGEHVKICSPVPQAEFRSYLLP